MKIITQIFTLFVLLLFPLVVFGQANSISSEKYWSAVNEAESKTENQIRKRVQIQKFYTNGEVTGTSTGTTEYIPPNRSRWINVEEKGSVVKRIEQITIGNVLTEKKITEHGLNEKRMMVVLESVELRSTQENFLLKKKR